MRNKTKTGRGRPRGKHRSPVDAGLLEYLAKISMKCEIDSGEFFENLVKAWKNQESACRGLIIHCRKRTQDEAVFLITSDKDVIAQFPASKYILEETNPLTEFTSRMEPLRKSVQGIRSNQYKIKDLRAGMKRINLRAKVLKISEPRLVVTNFGSYANVATAIVTDETGTIQLPLWNKQIDEISVGDWIQVENANVIIFRGERQLKINRNGKLNSINKEWLVARYGTLACLTLSTFFFRRSLFFFRDHIRRMVVKAGSVSPLRTFSQIGYFPC